MDSTSCQAERNFPVPNRTVDNTRFGMAVDKVEQLVVLRLNKQLIPKITSLREAEAEINTRTLARKKAVKGYVREAAAAATQPCAVGASDSSAALTGNNAAYSGPQSVEVIVVDKFADRIVQHKQVPT